MLRAATRLLCAFGAVTSLAACTPTQVGSATASLTARGLPAAPPPAPDGLPMPELSMDWALPVMSAGDVDALAEALGKHEAVELRLGPRLEDDPARERAHRVVASLSPETDVAVGQGEGRLESLVSGRLPLSRVGDPEVEQRPRYAAEGLVLDVSRWRPGAAAAPAKAVLALDRAALDSEAWRRQPASTVGSCRAPLAALGSGQEQSLAVLEPFLDHADAVLWTLYRAELGRQLPELRESLAAFEPERTRDDFSDDVAWQTYECGRAYADYVAEYSVCENDAEPCPFAPRVFLREGARIGAMEPTAFIPDHCAEAVGADYVARMRGMSRAAARTGGELLDAKWSSLADRLGALTEVAAAMEDVCTPRRRRFADDDLVEVRSRLARIGVAFREPAPVRDGARWITDDSEFHVPGIGPVHQLARFDAGASSASDRVVREARALREFVWGQTKCGATGGNLPLAALLVDLDGAQVDFLGYFYEEELFCAELPPLLAAG